MHRHNDYDDVKDNADGDAVVNDLDDRDFFVLDRAGAIYMQQSGQASLKYDLLTPQDTSHLPEPQNETY